MPGQDGCAAAREGENTCLGLRVCMDSCVYMGVLMCACPCVHCVSICMCVHMCGHMCLCPCVHVCALSKRIHACNFPCNHYLLSSSTDLRSPPPAAVLFSRGEGVLGTGCWGSSEGHSVPGELRGTRAHTRAEMSLGCWSSGLMGAEARKSLVPLVLCPWCSSRVGGYCLSRDAGCLWPCPSADTPLPTPRLRSNS